jgi:tRNA-2-methylthio-N6-dimethylallyladenosine synthase
VTTTVTPGNGQQAFRRQEPLRFFVHTYGCQMNEYDTNTIQSELVSGGHQLVDSAADASLIVLNTCAVRGKPVEKVLTLLGELRKERRAGRDLKIALMGCLAQLDEGREIAGRFGVDILIGPGAITDILPALDALEGGADSFSSHEFKPDLQHHITPAGTGLTSFLTIMRGCNHHCTYCIVPATRGPEVSRPVEAILQEARALQEAGAQELYLLGQNVNSYGLGDPALPSYAELLRLVAQTGIPRVKFTTSHPMNFTEDIIDAIADEPNVCSYIHLPVQSGSDRVLKRMGREYRRDRYLAIIDSIRQKIPDVVISTDIIVGFPGETEEDFQATLSLYDEVQFEQAYMFNYSARPGTPSAKHFTDMPREVKTERLQRLIERQKHWSLVRNRELIGRELRVLVKDAAQDGAYVFGHSDQNHTVLIPREQVQRMGLYRTVIDTATPHTLYGHVAGHDASAVPLVMAR